MQRSKRMLAAAALTTILIAALLASCASLRPVRSTRAPARTTATDGAPAMSKADGLATPAREGSAEPRLAATRDGAVLMSWLEPAADRRSGKPSRALQLALLKGSRWSPVLTIAEGDSLVGNWADFPAACPFGAHGLAVAYLWKSRREDATEIRLTLSSDGGENWTRPIVVHDDRDGSVHGFVSLIEQGTGVRVVWLDGHNLGAGVEEGAADMTLHSRFVSPSGSLGLDQELDGRTCDCCQTAAVMAGGDVVVAYRDRDPDEIRDIAVVRLDGGKWGAPVMVRDDRWKMMGCPVNGPALAADQKRVALAWYTAAADSPRVYVAFSENAGRTFGPATRVDNGRPTGRVGVALLADGSAAVSWLEGDKTESRLRARFVRAGQRPGAAITVSRLPGARGSGVPQLARDGDRLVFAWTEPGKATKVKLAEVRPGGR